jgi:ribosomal silencing factor RsfS
VSLDLHKIPEALLISLSFAKQAVQSGKAITDNIEYQVKENCEGPCKHEGMTASHWCW